MRKDRLDPNLVAWLGDSDATPVADPLAVQLDTVYGGSPPQDAVKHAIRRLRQEIQAGQIFYSALDGTSLGTVYVAVSNLGLTALNFGIAEEEFLAEVERRTGIRPMQSVEHTREFETQVAAYLAGARTQFDLDIDLTTLTAFQRAVLEAAAQVPRGQVTTYAEIARRIGRPQAYRAVGQALGRNPVPLVIPCHRVVAADGSLSGYSGGGGIKTKARLLALEGARLA